MENSPRLASTGVSRRERVILLVSVLIIAICGLIYELIIGTLSSYLLGDTITQFSFTIGLYLFAMGIGALISRRIKGWELGWFITIELLVGLFGGSSALVLYAVFSGTEVFYSLTMVVVTLLVGITVGLEIPILTRIVASRTHLNQALSDVLSVDYLGALIASLLFPLLLLPLLGVTQTAFVTGLLNIAVAGLNLRLFRQYFAAKAARLLWIATVIIGLAMIAGLIFSTNAVALLEQHLYQDRIIHYEQTRFQRLVVTHQGSDLRLYINGDLQYSSRDEYRYHELLVHPAMSVARTHESILVLGGGDGVAVREILKYPDLGKITLVDLDPAMTQLARTFLPLKQVNQGALDDKRLTIINQDAYKFLQASQELYSAIIVDLPDPNNEGLSKLYSQQFYKMIAAHLRPDGAFVTQSASPYFVREAYWAIAHTVQSAGLRIVPYHVNVPSFGDWGYVLGTLRPLAPPRWDPKITCRFLTPQVWESAQYFDPDTAEVPTGISTLDKPILLRLYDKGWRSWE